MVKWAPNVPGKSVVHAMDSLPATYMATVCMNLPQLVPANQTIYGMWTNAASPTAMDSSLVYTDLYTIPQLCLCPADRDTYECEIVITTSPPITATDSVTLNVTADCETSCRYLPEYKHRGYIS